MTTLRDFQNEMAEVRMKENAKQRANALLEKEKDTKRHPKIKERDKEENGHGGYIDKAEINGVEDDRIQVLHILS